MVNISSFAKTLPDHILVEETIEVCGFDPRYLKPRSARQVVTRCVECGVTRKKMFGSAVSQRLCLKCSNRINSRAASGKIARSEKMKTFYALGGKHPTKGVGHTAASKLKMSETHKARKRAPLSEATRQRLAAHCHRLLLTKEVKERTAALNRTRRGPLSASYGKVPTHAKKVWYQQIDGAPVCFRSTWEAKFAEYLNANGVHWCYESQTFPVSYVLDGVNLKGTYTPDFQSNGAWFEVKGRWTAEGLAKYQAFLNQYPNEKITVIDRQWLVAHHLL